MAKHKRQAKRQRGIESEPRSEASTQNGGLTFNPFAGLAQLAASLPSGSASPSDADQASGASATAPAEKGQETGGPVPSAIHFRTPVTVRTENKGRHGKVVTRVIGVDFELLKQLGVRMQRALGCGSVIEGQDLVLLGAVEARAAAWLRNAGATRVRAASETSSRVVDQSATPLAGRLEPSGRQRQGIQPGQRVAIVLKEDQRSGNLTEGIVEQLLTRSPSHPHGIKVRLVSGLVGRVKRILEP